MAARHGYLDRKPSHPTRKGSASTGAGGWGAWHKTWRRGERQGEQRRLRTQYDSIVTVWARAHAGRAHCGPGQRCSPGACPSRRAGHGCRWRHPWQPQRAWPVDEPTPAPRPSATLRAMARRIAPTSPLESGTSPRTPEAAPAQRWPQAVWPEGFWRTRPTARRTTRGMHTQCDSSPDRPSPQTAAPTDVGRRHPSPAILHHCLAKRHSAGQGMQRAWGDLDPAQMWTLMAPKCAEIVPRQVRLRQ